MLKDKVKVYKDVFSEEDVKIIQGHLNTPNWAWGNYSDEKSKHKPFWGMHLGHLDFFSKHLYKIVYDLIQSSYTGEAGQLLSIERIYANGQTFGLDGSWHIDNPFGCTFLYYANTEWKEGWEGNTVFRDPKTDEIFSIYPEPNSAILFPGNVLHYGQAPSKDFTGLRTTISYKLFKTKYL